MDIGTRTMYTDLQFYFQSSCSILYTLRSGEVAPRCVVGVSQMGLDFIQMTQ